MSNIWADANVRAAHWSVHLSWIAIAHYDGQSLFFAAPPNDEWISVSALSTEVLIKALKEPKELWLSVVVNPEQWL